MEPVNLKIGGPFPKISINAGTVTLDDPDVMYLDDEGQYHREDGPVLSLCDGTQIWYFHGKKHRHDGPAVIRPGKREEWWLHGVPFPKEYNDMLEHICIHSRHGHDFARIVKEVSSHPRWQAMHTLRMKLSAALADRDDLS